MICSSLRASSERPTTRPPAASISATSGASFSPFRRPRKTVKPSEANFLAIAAPMKSPAPITATVAFLYSKTGLLLDRCSTTIDPRGPPAGEGSSAKRNHHIEQDAGAVDGPQREGDDRKRAGGDARKPKQPIGRRRGLL